MTSSYVIQEIWSHIAQVTLLLSNAMFYNRWVLLWALWLIYNGPHCGIRHDTLPAPYMCAVVTCCVMETVISGAMLFGRTDMPLWVCVVIGKSRELRGVRAAAQHLISQPNSPEEGLFKFGSVPRLELRPDGWCEVKRWLLAWSSIWPVVASVFKSLIV